MLHKYISLCPISPSWRGYLTKTQTDSWNKKYTYTNMRPNIMREKPWKIWMKALPAHRFMLTHWGMNKIAKFYRWHFRMHFLVRKLLPFDSHITMFHKGSALAYVGIKPSPEPIDLIPEFVGVYMCHHRSILQRNNELIIMQQIILFQSLFWRLNPPTSKGHGKCNVKT